MKLWRDLGDLEVAPYAPITGDPTYLAALSERHWPGLGAPKSGCATPGGSGALALSVKNFLEPGMAVAAMAPYWGPYDTLSAEGGASIAALPYPATGLDRDAWGKVLGGLMASQGRVLLWLNDPCHNPRAQASPRPTAPCSSRCCGKCPAWAPSPCCWIWPTSITRGNPRPCGRPWMTTGPSLKKVLFSSARRCPCPRASRSTAVAAGPSSSRGRRTTRSRRHWR